MTVPAPSRIQLPDAPADQQAVLAAGGVACWEDVIEIDTYEPAAPDRYPHFLDRRVYQGSSGKIYPMPMTDAVAHEKAPRAWRAIHLENRFVRLLLLPEIGGRIHIGYDKVAGYDFFYRNNVIKPALVGLGGPWISGGIEFNWPQHHRPGTYLPVDARIEREHDGAVVVWHSDLDPLQRMRGTHGIRLRPESSLIEADVRLHNRTDVTQTFLWWANVAAAAHERYQSFFPDDVAFVADHARRAITAFPRADRAYYGVDYPALAAERADADRIDFYSNIPVPTSYMITDTDDDFFGGYDHRADAGFVHWADRAISPGKKQWTWGDGPIGRAWDAQLTDDDGPYVELMAGVYTDNQPDFAWLVPGETKTFRQYWYPIHAIGPARQATREAAVALGGDADGRARIGVLATAEHADVTVRAVGADGDLATWTGAIGPAAPYTALLDAAADDVREIVVTAGGRELVRWVARSEAFGEPWVATVPPMPEEIAAADELVQTATHLTQNRHPSRSAEPYLRAVLDRDPSDTRATTALAARKLAAGEYAEAVDLLEAAMTRLTSRNLNPRDGEAGHLLGLAYERLGCLADADRAFARAGWNAAFAPAAAIARARIALRRGAARDALELLQSAASVPAAGPLRVLALRLLGDDAAAATIADELRDRDPLDPMVQALFGAVRTYDPRTALDIASELARAGRYDAAFAATADIAPVDGRAAFAAGGPVTHYLRAHWAELAGDTDRAVAERTAARAADTTYAFPAGLDAYDALSAAIAADPHDAVARGLRGMWLLDAGRTTDAHDDLVAATDHGATDAVTWRNLALSTVAVTGDLDAADAAFVRALELSRDARLVFERDVLARVRGLDAAARRVLLDAFADLLLERDDLAVEHVGLLLDEGRLDEAEQILRARSFRPFEGGEGRVIALFDRADAERARLLLDTDPSAAASRLAGGIDAPANLGEGRHPADPIAERLYLLGEAHAAAGDTTAATAAWLRATAASPLDVAPRPADERDLWIGLALHRLGRDAGAVWERLEARADELEREKDIVDYFATSVPELLLFDVDTSGARTRAAAHLRSLAGRGRTETAR